MNTRATTSEKASSARRREPLTRERIIEAALHVMDAEGLDAVTMRRIGRELGVEAMSLYNHVEDKDDILEGVTERAMNEFEFPPSSGEWTEDAFAMSREWRRLLRLHPSVCQLLAERHKPMDGLAAFRAMDAALGVLREAGLSDREAAQAFNALGSYILGFVMMEQGLMLGADEDHAKQHEQMVDTLQGAGLPNVVACFPYFADCSTDEQFDFGLDLMIRGIRARVEDRTPVA
ncbi:MAG TPA: TetR/AcrR family transcriptional regulator [Actinomycetota bacterium]|nr:TetR/AcrR family transcriptional regulator [Actinomycetota bacterium]